MNLLFMSSADVRSNVYAPAQLPIFIPPELQIILNSGHYLILSVITNRALARVPIPRNFAFHRSMAQKSAEGNRRSRVTCIHRHHTAISESLPTIIFDALFIPLFFDILHEVPIMLS